MLFRTLVSSEEIMNTLKSYSGTCRGLIYRVCGLGCALAIACCTASSVLAQDDLIQPPVLDGPIVPGLIPGFAPQDSQGDVPPVQLPPTMREFDAPAEVKKVNDSVAGWNSAEAGRAFNLGDTLRRNWVMVDSEGKLRGQVLGSDFDHQKTEVFFLNEGIMIEKVTANAKGEFVVNGLEGGVYTLLVANEGRYAVNCLLIMDNSPMGGPPSSFDVPMSENSPRSVFEQVVSRATKVRFRNYGEFAFEQTAEDPTRLYGLKGLAEHRPAAVDATTLGNNRVQLTTDGLLIGRLRAVEHLGGRPVDLMVTDVMLIADDEIVATVQTNRYGVFQFDEDAPGFYTLFAAGKDGIAVTGFEVLGSASGIRPVGFKSRKADNYLDVSLSPRRDIGWINAYFLDHVPAPRTPPVEDVPYDPFHDHGNWGWPHGGMGMPFGADGWGCDACCDACCEMATSGLHFGGRAKRCLRRHKASSGCLHHDGCDASYGH